MLSDFSKWNAQSLTVGDTGGIENIGHAVGGVDQCSAPPPANKTAGLIEKY